MSDAKNEIKDVEESSTVGASLTGFQGPKISNQRKKQLSKPFVGTFEEAVAYAVMNGRGDDIEEVVKKRGNQWVFYDDETDVQRGSYADRDTAWEVQRQHRRAQQVAKHNKNTRKKRDPSKAIVDKPPSNNKEKAKPVKFRKQEALNRIKGIMKESFMSYVFEQAPVSGDAAAWEKFLERLSRETVMSDPKLKSILEKSIKSEMDLLKRSVLEIKKILESTKSFSVKEKGVEKDKESQRIKTGFDVEMKKNKKTLPFSVQIENGRPLIMFPDESKDTINALANNESKLLRAELMHAQETVLDKMPEVVDLNGKRDKYLSSVQAKIDKTVEQFNLLEISMLKYLLKNKYKGVG